MNYSKQLAQILATIQAKQKQIGDIMTKSVAGGHTPSDDDEAQITVLEGEIARLEKNAERLQKLIKSVETAPNPTEIGGENPEQAAASATGEPIPKETKSVKVESNLPKGIGFAQMARAKALSSKLASKGDFVSAVEIAKSAGMHPVVIAELEKSVTVMDTSNSSVLVPTSPLTSEFIELLRAQTIIDKLAKYMRAGDFNSTIAGMATGATSAWVGEGEPKPVTNATFNSVELKRHKVAGIAVLTDELSRFNKFNGDRRILDDLIESNRLLLDLTFIDDQAQSTTRPAGSLHGATIINATGSEEAQIKADLAKLRQVFIKANLSLTGAHYIMSETRASEWAELTNPLGAPVFTGLQAPTGEKTLNGLPVIESESASNIVELVKPSEFYLADEGQVEVSYSTEATITMPNKTLVHLFQENKEAIRAERFITWAKRRPMAAAAIKYED
ncbi:phage major capsid protein [Moraxella bovis]|uniref:Predicted phage phi-C31 gp36 major capsid-like protein n=1 Tax=Moraxella bovis TaxID=476 RepID=A0A2Z4R6W7_MORBO|nr:phage major capsid protein [Moraxella bovis]AWY20102.1 phage major capsid protein [Moraxella bovis]STY90193.1 Predicted phage phi-C31 gp36 major capsid-like protein [Moraxella bovis]